LAAEGARVALACRERLAEAEEAATACDAAGAEKTAALRGDLASEAEVAEMFRGAESSLGPIRVLVNNAAICPHGTTAGTELETWERTIGANLTGTFLCCREFLRRLEGKGPPGRIVNVSSVSAFSGSTSGQAAYDASKGGIVSFTMSLARETAKLGITANALAPGLMMT
jgi:3-oxoacyl-[acyl-carrier protein] reductase